MTSTRSKVSRVTESTYNVLYSGVKQRRAIVVTLAPGDVLVFREQGRRERFSVPIDTTFKFAVRCNVFAKMLERKAAGKLKPKKKK